MPEAAVRSILCRGREFGCTEALFTFGERPEQERGFLPYIEAAGYPDILSYCVAMSRAALGLGLLPHTNAGVLTYEELEQLRCVNASMGLMLETTAEVPAHKKSPGKEPAVRLEMMENAGKLKIPFTTGLLLGIGESEADREESLQAIRELHRRYGHIQEVIVQNFCPKEGTKMAGVPGAGVEVMRETVLLAAEILPKDVTIQIPPNLADASSLLALGVGDLGGVSPVTIDFINPEHPWPELDALRDTATEYDLRERLCVYPRYCTPEWIAPEVWPRVRELAERVYTAVW